MMIRPGAILIVLALIGVVLASAWTSLTVQQDDRLLIDTADRQVMARKLRLAQRVPYYRITRERGPTFRLTGTEKKLRLISHLILRPGAEYDPRRRLRYGLRVRISKDGDVVAEFEVHTQTRQSKDRKYGGMWLDENAFTRDRKHQIADDRLFPIYMPENLPADSTLEVRLLGNDGDEGLIRAYNELERDDRDREVAARSLSPIARRDQVWTNTYTPWSMLSDDEQDLRVRFATERLSVMGKSGTDYEIVTIRYTGFRLPLELIEDIGPQPLEIDRYRYAAVNIDGPATLTFRARWAPGAKHDSTENRPTVELDDLNVIAVPATDNAPLASDPLPTAVAEPPGPKRPPASKARPRLTRAQPKPDKDNKGNKGNKGKDDEDEDEDDEDDEDSEENEDVFTLQVPPGLHSVQFGGRSPEPLHILVEGPKNSPFGAPAEYGREIGRLYPDYIRIPVYVSGPGWRQSVEVAGLGDLEAIGRRLKIEARFFVSPSLPEQLSGIAGRLGDLPDLLTRWSALDPGGIDVPREPTFRGTLTAKFYDRDGALKDTATYTRSSVRAPFEWIELATESPEPIAVAEPNDIRLIVPRGVFRIELSSSHPAALRLFRYLPGQQLYRQPYRDVEFADKARWRYARIEKRVWWPMRPLNLRRLAGGVTESLSSVDPADEARGAESGSGSDSPSGVDALVTREPDIQLTGSSPADRLVNPSQLATLVAQVRVQRRGYRLELDQGGDTGDDKDDEARSDRRTSLLVVKPIGRHERHDIIEPIPPERRAPSLERWGPGMLAELPTDRDAPYTFSGSGYRDARVHYWLAPSDLGREVTIEVNGQPITFELLNTTSGFLDLPTLSPGIHRLRGRSSAPSLRLYIERPVVDAPPGSPVAATAGATAVATTPTNPPVQLYRRREVYAMDRQPMPVRVYRPLGKEPRLNVVHYAPWRESNPTTPDVRTRCLIGGGQPRRIEGVPVRRFTDADRMVALPNANRDAAPRFADAGSGSPGYPRRFAIPLGDDLAVGTHVIECYSVNGYRLWTRFFVTDSQMEYDEKTLQWKVRSTP